MPNHEEIPTTDTAQIEQLIERLKQGKLQQQDAQLIETLLNFVLKITSLLKRKQTTIKGLKQIFFGSGLRSGSENKSDHQAQRQLLQTGRHLEARFGQVWRQRLQVPRRKHHNQARH